MAARLNAVLSRHGYLLAIVAIALSTLVFLAGRGLFAKGQWALLYLLDRKSTRLNSSHT